MTRTILHIDMDAFFVSVEQALDPTLRGRPVIVGGDPNGRGVVAAASYEARRFGVRSAMPLAHARSLCPDAIFLRGNHRKYAKASREVLHILHAYSPIVEPISIDEAYVDFTGCERLHGPPMETAHRIRQEILQKLALSASVGISTSRLVSKVASKAAKPAGIMEVRPGYERSFLAPLPVEALPGVGPRSRDILHRFNIQTIGTLAQLDPVVLEQALGRVGPFLHLQALGTDITPVVPEETSPRSIGREITFQRDTLDRRYLEAVLYSLAERVGRALRRRGLRGRCIHLKLRYSDFATISRSVTLSEPTDMDHEIFREALGLMERALTRRIRVRLLGVSISRLAQGPCQLPLFGRPQTLRMQALYAAVDRIRRRYGPETLRIGRTLQATGFRLHSADDSRERSPKNRKLEALKIF